MGKADLHIHTTASDGRLRPEEVAPLARENGLEVIAITDHDTIEGYARAREAGEKIGVEVLTGVELTCDYNGSESHLLAYCFDAEDPEFQKLLSNHKKARLERMEWIVGELAKQGLDIDKEEVRAEASGGNVGRPHAASVLVKKGYVGSAKEAFIRYLGNHALGPIQNYYASHLEAIQAVKDAGGATVLAHPNRFYTQDELEEWVEAGLDGIEVIHPSHDYEQQKYFQKFAQENNLLITGGSDYHGNGSGYLRHFGIVTMSLTQVSSLKRMTEQRKKISV
ncbi:PHP domain-containing protein [Aliifodinibius sp. S!AR15-10]|uniref:PHP domain-containing protein n=1 Tax=Aliifodinibius sp. S!AR15-10 TaxID=2950437 RepID=UPI00286094E7|nr:PHP domain-containing protein [Aliifodinibius sp. S!AR15-10]MDR8389792.1 PHP domain-containing protein [Aliifodinibius sp. S!AR15-10]